MQPNILLVRYGEIFLKGQNRPYFISALVNKVKQAVKPIGAHVFYSDSRIYVRADDLDDCARRVCNVFGVHSVSLAIELDKKDIDVIGEAAVSLLEGKKGTFKINSRRSDKTFPMNSIEISTEVGGRVLEKRPDLVVDIHKPEHVVEVEVRDMVYVHSGRIMGMGGMPIGTSGKAMLLLSGGIDSPVAGFMMAKRGLMLEAIHFASPPYTSEQAKEKVVKLLSILSKYCGNLRMHVVPFTKIQMEIYEKCPEDELTVIMRRFMMRIAQRIAEKTECGALITGESMGQVASQTMLSLNCTNSAVDMLVLRPLIGFDKTDIIDVAEKIDSYETSILPFEDCCTVFTPKHPVTKPKLSHIEKSEQRLDVDALIEDAISGIEIIDVDSEGRI
ncbi:MAG: tRNA 4-thiouridine(8) synthase ThiI [Clostridiales bacterium]|nr:tRNA 4-thiouridine(8) synthase ThiI [Clostridiales bacterium]MBQ2817598.1 tRNA 4-thiouridine(8) synthase ThiI [Clostridia bacterium]